MAKSKFGLGIVTDDYSEGWISSCLSDSTQKYTVLTSVPDGTGSVSAIDMGTDPRVIPISDSATLADNYHYSSSAVGDGVYGVYNPSGSISTVPAWEQLQTATTNQASYPAAKTWTAANPYGALQKDEKMYLSDYDNGKIFRYTTTSNAYSEDAFGSNPYYFAPTLPTGATRAGAMGMDVQANGMVAAFTFYGVSGWNYTYQPSGLYLLPVNNTATASVSALASTTCTENVNGTTVHGDFVYTTAFGGMQKAGGNAQDPDDPTAPISTLEVFKINASGTGFLPSFHKKITPAMLPSASSYGTKGDFLGVEIVLVGGVNYAFILLANYDSGYTQYTYQILKVAETTLQSGSLSGATYVTGIVKPASAAWGLLKDDNNDLYLVDGVHIKKINTSDLSMTTVCSASDFTSDGTSSGTAGGLINTAGIVIHASAGMLRGAPGAHVSVTKMAHRLITPEELKKRQKK